MSSDSSSGDPGANGDESLDELAERYSVDRIGEENRVPYFGIRSSDVWFIGGTAVAALTVALLAGLTLGALVAAGVMLGVGVYLLYVTPDHTKIAAWVKNMWRYLKRPSVTHSAPAGAPADERNAGGLLNRTPFQPDERTEELTGIRRAWVGDGAVLRRDGRLEGALEIAPGNMDFAPWTEWRDIQQTCQEYANKHTHSELKLHITTQEFGLDSLTDRLEQQLEDPMIQSRPTLAALLHEYRQRRPRQMREQGLQQHRIFLFVTVSAKEIEETHVAESTPAEKTAKIPVLGRLVEALPGSDVSSTRGLSPLEEHNEMVELLDKRLDDIRDDIVSREPKWDAQRVSTIELFQLARQFWTGSRASEAAIDRTLRQPAAATGRPTAGAPADTGDGAAAATDGGQPSSGRPAPRRSPADADTSSTGGDT